MQIPPNRLRSLALFLGVLVLIWIPIEDNQVYSALFLGTLATLLLFVHGGTRWPGLALPGRDLRWRGSWVGFAAGGTIPLLSVLFMALKTGLHGHAVPEYTGHQVIAVIALAPWMMAAGMIIGVAFGWLKKSREMSGG